MLPVKTLKRRKLNLPDGFLILARFRSRSESPGGLTPWFIDRSWVWKAAAWVVITYKSNTAVSEREMVAMGNENTSA